MNKNIRIAKELVRIAKEICSAEKYDNDYLFNYFYLVKDGVGSKYFTDARVMSSFSRKFDGYYKFSYLSDACEYKLYVRLNKSNNWYWECLADYRTLMAGQNFYSSIEDCVNDLKKNIDNIDKAVEEDINKKSDILNNGDSEQRLKELGRRMDSFGFRDGIQTRGDFPRYEKGNCTTYGDFNEVYIKLYDTGVNGFLLEYNAKRNKKIFGKFFNKKQEADNAVKIILDYYHLLYNKDKNN